MIGLVARSRTERASIIAGEASVDDEVVFRAMRVS
jgi:hypothetical protein